MISPHGLISGMQLAEPLLVGGSGGVSLTGTGINQTTSVFGRIAANTVLPNIAGNYTDDVIVTITY